MNKKLIQELKKVLEQQKKKLEEELKGFADSSAKTHGGFATSFPQYGDKEDENAAEVATFTDNLSLEKTLERNLTDVKQALVRIKKESYGICKYCNQEISEGRLRARPESGSCISCKSKQLAKK
ncbi:MAG: TraR/DksA family transcriptional regulator [Patescibacteria group bacterium]